ncbi:MAG: flagellar biosynthetic protein FliR [Anaerolineales bacterium]|nr:flagellar biosynthetic protein FliR [Anaerolineales bacterium]
MLISLPQFQLFFLALTRIMALIIHIPVLAGPAIPNPMKIALGSILAMITLPWTPLPSDAVAQSLFPFSVAIGQELLIGTLAGFAATLTFGAVQIAGDMMDTSLGFSAGRLFNPALENPGAVGQQFFSMLAAALFLVTNGHHLFLIGLQKTFTIAPLNAALPQLDAEPLLTLAGGLIAAGIQLSLPVVAAALLTEVTLGLLARVAPTLQVFFLGMPLKAGLGLLALTLTLTTILPTLTATLHMISQWMLELIS